MILCSQLLAGEYELSSCITERERERKTSRAVRDGVREIERENRRGRGPFHTALQGDYRKSLGMTQAPW